MNTETNSCIDSITQEIQDDIYAVAPAIKNLADLSRLHYKAAAEIHANMAWQSQVLRAAAAVGVRGTHYLTLVERSREILLFGPTYVADQDGCRIVFGASLLDEGGFVPLEIERAEEHVS